MVLSDAGHRAKLTALFPIRWLVPGNCAYRLSEPRSLRRLIRLPLFFGRASNQQQCRAQD
jgi:hypothetical protein